MDTSHPTGRLSPFERNIAEQPEALDRLAAHGDYTDLRRMLSAQCFERIVLTGMGSSHFAGLPTWRALTGLGLPAWWVDTGRLLDAPELVTPRTLLIATSQSGASGEVVQALDVLGAGRRGGPQVIGVTNDTASPLAQAAALTLPLFSGDEATVSTKSYLNTLAVHGHIVAAFAGDSPDVVDDDIRATASAVAGLLGTTAVDDLARRAVEAPDRRLAAVGTADDGATALFAGLITKESAKVAIEGFIGGQFRHGPFELAGPGLTVFAYGADGSDAARPTIDLAEDALATGADVVLIGDADLPGATTLHASRRSPLQRLATGAVAAQVVAAGLARAHGVVPGAFAYGSKVTTKL